MVPEGQHVPAKLTICAIGSSQSSHVVSRVQCFAERGHRVFLITNRVAGLDRVTELVPRVSCSLALDGVLRWVEARCSQGLTKSIALLIRGVSLLLSYPKFLKLLKQCRPDVVHVHYAYNIWAWMAAVSGHHPLVVSTMGGDVLFDEQGSPTPWGKWLTRQLLKSADLITTKSDYLSSALERLGGFGAKTIKVVWGVDLKRFHAMETASLRARLGFKPQQRLILSPKILQPFYNVHLIVEAMPDILEAVPDAALLITEYLADADYKQQIVKRIQQAGLQKAVRFVGHVPHPDMPLYYSLADATVALPSSDGLPQTLLEGMACKVPNILSRLPRYEEIVTHEHSAYFVDARPASIAEGVIRLLGDADLADRIVHNGREIVRTQADFAREVSRVESIYYDLLAQSQIQ